VNVWLFSGADGLSALTIDGEGTNLPDELGPWTKVRAVELHDDTPDEQEGGHKKAGGDGADPVALGACRNRLRLSLTV
jgi:hypothetical protein